MSLILLCQFTAQHVSDVNTPNTANLLHNTNTPQARHVQDHTYRH